MNKYSFDPLFYPLYALLKPEKKKVYEQIYYAIKESKPRVKIVEKCNSSEVFAITHFVCRDHPEFFWGGDSPTVWVAPDNLVCFVDFTYRFSGAKLEKMKTQLSNAVTHFIQGADGKSVLEKEKMIHDRLAKQITYEFNEYDQTVYGALVNRRAVCAGISRGFQLLMRVLEVPCFYLTGWAYSKNNWGRHGWNLISIGGQFYNVDTTWDSTDSGQRQQAHHYYYNCTDDKIAHNHKRDEISLFLPGSNRTDYTFENIYGISADEDRVFQDGVTHKKIVKSKKDFLDIIIPELNHNKQNRVVAVAFLIKNKEMSSKCVAWLQEVMKASTVRQWETRCKLWKYASGDYKFLIGVRKSVD